MKNVDITFTKDSDVIKLTHSNCDSNYIAEKLKPAASAVVKSEKKNSFWKNIIWLVVIFVVIVVIMFLFGSKRDDEDVPEYTPPYY